MLSKSLNEFYLAILENKPGLITDKEYENLTKGERHYHGDTRYQTEDFVNMIEFSERLKKYISDIMKAVYSIAQVRQLAVLTMIADDIYDIGSYEFINLDRVKIIRFDNLLNYYNETNARIRFFTPKEKPRIKEKMVLLDVDDESIVNQYLNTYINQEESDDLLEKFISEYKEKSKKKKK